MTARRKEGGEGRETGGVSKRETQREGRMERLMHQ